MDYKLKPLEDFCVTLMEERFGKNQKKMAQYLHNLYFSYDFNNFSTFSAQFLFNQICEYSNWEIFDIICDNFPDWTDTHIRTLIKHTFKRVYGTSIGELLQRNSGDAGFDLTIKE